jgi:hypothetical protein
VVTPFADRAVVRSLQSPFGRRPKGRQTRWKRRSLAARWRPQDRLSRGSRSRKSKALLAGVPEALPTARIGIVPAQAGPGGCAGPGRRRRRADKAKRRTGRNCAARRPTVTGTSPTAIAVNPAGTISPAAISSAAIGPATVGATAIRAPTVGPSATVGAAAIGSAAVGATTAIRPAAAMHSTSAMHSTAVAHPPASATGPRFSDEAVVHVGCDARRSEDLEGLSLRQTKTEKRNAKNHGSGQTRPTHGFPPRHRGQFAAWKFQYPHEAVARPDRDSLRQP